MELDVLVSEDSAFNDELISNLQLEIGKPENNMQPKEVLTIPYGEKDAERWIKEFREAMETATQTSQSK